MKSSRLLAGLSAVIAVGALAGCATTDSGSGSGSDSGSGGTTSQTLTTIIGNDIDSLDPQAQGTTSVMQIVDMMVEELTAIDATGTAQPELAESWETSEDGKTWTFKLKSGVKFSDGAAFDAEAAKFSLDRLLSPDTYKAAPNELAVIDSVEATDASTLTITTKTPFPALAQALSLPIAGVISPDSVTAEGNTAEQIKVPVGTGPYVYDSYTAGDHITMTRNDAYWGEEPAYQTQTYRFVTDASARMAALQSGDAQVIASPPASSLSQLENSAEQDLLLFDSSYSVQIGFNTQNSKNPKLNDPKVRQALSLAIDRDTVIEKVLFGTGTQLTGPLPKSVAGNADAEMPGYDPDQARQLLAEAGASDLKLTMVSSDGRFLNDYKVAQAVAGYLRDVGVEVTLENPTDFTTYLAGVMVDPKEATSDLRLIGWGSIYLDASQALLQFRSDQVPPNGFNGTYFSDEKYDELVLKGNGTIDAAEREAAYAEAQEYLVSQAPTMWLYQVKNAVATSSGVTGVEGLANNMFVTTWATPAS
ncbi:glutathione ABC transporter substrate-binding protein [Kineosporia sp. NBRC 101677]|uniref:ABC transporter substrate-binding protein n=1 Tax=Kineosporia sp. NBRC 101677 TaxID=3032197 RepID=UPI0024A1FF2A|nr:ABC transporter substrate-binding protein [Kineosporia sp. NBRC 101677]GLY15104.1 glutathione ABC transporter substrate-binding protein [Kineosporia sp. NBRC 101677]